MSDEKMSFAEKMLAKKKEEQEAKDAVTDNGTGQNSAADAQQAAASGPGQVATGLASSMEIANTPANTGMVHHGDTDNPEDLMGKANTQLQAGLAQVQLDPTLEARAVALAEGEAKRQRLLAGRPLDTDLVSEDTDMSKPGGFKSNGILKFVNKAGNWVHAVEGWFFPQSEEEQETLEHYVKTGVVEPQVPPENES